MKAKKPKPNIKAYMTVITDTNKLSYEVDVDNLTIKKESVFDGIDNKETSNLKLNGTVLKDIQPSEMLKLLNSIISGE